MSALNSKEQHFEEGLFLLKEGITVEIGHGLFFPNAVPKEPCWLTPAKDLQLKVHLSYFCRQFSLGRCLTWSMLVEWGIMDTKVLLGEICLKPVYFEGDFEAYASFKLGQGDGTEGWSSSGPSASTPLPAGSCHLLGRQQGHKTLFALGWSCMGKAHLVSTCFLSLVCHRRRTRKRSWERNARFVRNPL